MEAAESIPTHAHALEGSLCAIARHCYARGWALGTSGNFSAVVSRRPLLLTITATGLDKANLTPANFVQIDDAMQVLSGHGRPSAEAALHVMLAEKLGAGAVLHTHSVWSTILSDAHSGERGLWIEGYEMLKGLEGVKSHHHREWLPVFENDQDIDRLAELVRAELLKQPQAHGFLLRKHGLYTWGEGLDEAKRHLEILEFLLEAVGRRGAINGPAE
jgi:methylthioribulose-1-phosphate dehydratase